MTVFSFGAGQESVYLLHRLIHDPEFRQRHVRGELLVVGSDTGAEHPHTYAAIAYCIQFCKEHNVKFYWVTPDQGFHPKTWQSLTYQYERNCSIGSASYQQTCTDNLKVKVVNNFTEHYIKVNYQVTGERKRAYYNYVLLRNRSEKIRLILGFARGEEHRITNGNKFDPKWKKETVERYYPLMIEGIARQQCIDYNSQNIPVKIWPSNCMMCFYQSNQEIVWLYRFYPKVFQQWVELERNKLEKYRHKEKNFGVYGRLTLEQKLEKALSLYGHWTDEELNEYKFSHGHCIKSKY